MSNKVKVPSTGLRLAIDAGPLAVFFAVNTFAGGPQIARALTATVAFMVAIAIAMVVSRVKLGRISPMLWMSGGLVFVFGALTLYFHDTTFIKVKPTIVYAMLSAVLVFGLVTGRPLLRTMLESAYPGLTAEGWLKLTINWAVFFAVMAVANEIAWRTLAPGDDLGRWAAFKLWVVMPATFVFALANIPMLLRHGLMIEDAQKPPVPPEG
ncbi:MAG: inner membrane-spanning protein YciB [Pseudomonadota bacterium]